MSKIWSSLGLAVLGIAILVGAAAAAGNNAVLTGNPVNAFEIASYPTGDDLTLTVTGTNPATYAANLVVNANSAWTVTATADSATGHTQGYMSKYTAGTTNAYASPEVKLYYPMKISSPYVTTAASLASTGVSIETGTESETDEITFSQQVAWSDIRLTGTDESYRMVVTFTIG